jgi:hypothetical protein
MKIWSGPCSDVGMTVLNYNRPKVEEAFCCAGRRSLPLPTVTLVSAAGCMQENPVVSDRYSPFLSHPFHRV